MEFLRYLVYKTTGKTLLIKDRATITLIKDTTFKNVENLFATYESDYGLKHLAGIFYRFKPIFLAFRAAAHMKPVINRIRRLAENYHSPMPEDYLNEITAKVERNEPLLEADLKEELNTVNPFRKIRLAYALKYRTKDADSILYRIRNGKSYAKSFDFQNKQYASDVLDIVLESITDDLRENVEGKRIFIPENIEYSLPTTEKQFTGMFPSGTSVKIPTDMVFGVYWENVGKNRIDLDLSLINLDAKYGWDGVYRNKDRSILFSGDMTDAKDGASELFYIQRQEANSFLFCLNYFNYDPNIEVPFKLFVAHESIKNMKQNYMVDPNNIVAQAGSTVRQRQLVLGVVVVNDEESTFYFAETSIGNSISARGVKYVDDGLKYLKNYYTNTINLRSLLESAGAILSDQESCNLDLSPEKLEKDTIINLLVKK